MAARVPVVDRIRSPRCGGRTKASSLFERALLRSDTPAPPWFCSPEPLYPCEVAVTPWVVAVECVEQPAQVVLGSGEALSRYGNSPGTNVAETDLEAVQLGHRKFSNRATSRHSPPPRTTRLRTAWRFKSSHPHRFRFSPVEQDVRKMRRRLCRLRRSLLGERRYPAGDGGRAATLPGCGPSPALTHTAEVM
jgi:hypothetical protein